MAQKPNNDLHRQLMSIFIVEAQEHLTLLNQDLLHLEANQISEDRVQLLADIMRAAHSLKGAARAVNQKEIENLAHQLENFFVYLQENLKELISDDFSILFRTLDSIGTLVEKASGKDVTPREITQIVSELDSLFQAIQTERSELEEASEQIDKKKVRKKSQAPQPASQQQVEQVSEDELQKVESPAEKIEIDQAFQTEKEIEDRQDVEQQPGSHSPAHAVHEETIRLTISKLDSLLSLMGELKAAHIENKQRLIELNEMSRFIDAWESRWRKVQTNYQKINIANEVILLPEEKKPIRTDPAHDISKQHVEKPVLEFLQTNESNLRTVQHRIDRLIHMFSESERRMDQVADEMEIEIRKTRMVPISTLFDIFPRIVRDLAIERGKEIQLHISGEDIEVDRSVLEKLRDPLLHIIRNSVDHGIEEPKIRSKAEKKSQGTICLTAEQHGDHLVLKISDDGSGIDIEAVKAVAVRKKLLSKKKIAELNNREILNLVFQPGFSTQNKVTEVSGRGVGLDVVYQHIKDLHGLINLENAPGEGLQIILTVPLTVSSTNCLLIQAGGWKVRGQSYPVIYAIPITNVLHLMRLKQEEIGSVEGRQAISVNNEPVEVWHLSDILGVEHNLSIGEGDLINIVLVRAAEKQIALIVDLILGTQEVVIKNLPWPMMRVQNVTGASILGTGEVVIALNMTEMLTSLDDSRNRLPKTLERRKREKEHVPVVMIADDSITTRTLEKRILEAAGYDVFTASDGLDAWSKMQSESCDLVVSDVMMPELDGFGLTRKIRSDERFKHLPVILVTSLNRTQDREQGMNAGADAYIVKSAFDQDKLLEVVQRLI